RPLNEVREEEKNKDRQSKLWTSLEDSKLRELVAVSGPQKWSHIGKQMQGRTGKTCRSRWFNYLDPKINKDAFSDEENEKLLKAHKELGNKWSRIAKRFHGRTDRAVHKQFDKLMRRELKKPSSASPHDPNDKAEG
ncbi:hypothetical protein CARUB_v10006405mg, partial [Capsella rubella]